MIGLSQRLNLLRNEGNLLSISFSNGHNVSPRHRELVIEKLFPNNTKLDSNGDIDGLVETLLLAAYVVSSLQEGSKYIVYKNSVCVSTSNLCAIGLNFQECFSDDAIFLDNVVFTSKFARANNLSSAFSRLFAVHERMRHADKKTIVEEYASTA